LRYQDLPFTLKEDCDRKKYMCCTIIKKIYKILNKPFNPDEIFLTYWKVPKVAKNIPTNVKELIDRKAFNPQYIRSAIKNNHESCIYELLRFEFETALSVKTCIAYERFHLLYVFFHFWNGNYFPVHSIKNFKKEKDEAFTDDIKDNANHGEMIPDLSYIVLCGVHRALPILLNFYESHDTNCILEDEQLHPLYLAYSKGDVYSIMLLLARGYSLKGFSLMKTCSPGDKQ
jgi:hypothetical protein